MKMSVKKRVVTLLFDTFSSLYLKYYFNKKEKDRWRDFSFGYLDSFSNVSIKIRKQSQTFNYLVF